ncbi:hypothetical protein SDC9_111500 [bioreactor metagenome]|uniref:Uncharacterized protein n=1 Tax=bioreactor metagenome TaxID=1076179 RepID=A0A645BMW1_9ZZZZ
MVEDDGDATYPAACNLGRGGEKGDAQGCKERPCCNVEELKQMILAFGHGKSIVPIA